MLSAKSAIKSCLLSWATRLTLAGVMICALSGLPAYALDSYANTTYDNAAYANTAHANNINPAYGALNPANPQGLPPVVLQALARANLKPHNISIVVMPLTATTNSNNAENNAKNNAKNNARQPQPARSNNGLPEPVLPEPVLPKSDLFQTEDTASLTEQTASQQAPIVAALPQPAPLPLPALKHGISHNAATLRTPASTMKLIPTFIALDLLGGDFTWQNRVFYTGLKIGNRLYGDLIIQGSGDPKLTSERLSQLLYQVKRAGIEHINGNIIIDSSVFTGVTKDPAAFDNKPLRPYNASPDGFLVNFSSLEVQSFIDSKNRSPKAQLLYKPKLKDFTMPADIGMRPVPSCRRARHSLAPSWQDKAISFAKRLPTGCGNHTFYVAHPNAKVFASAVVGQVWADLGNTLTGTVINRPYRALPYQYDQPLLSLLPVSALPIANYPSYPLTRIIYDINHYSNNVMTEQVLLSLPVYTAFTTLADKPNKQNPMARENAPQDNATQPPLSHNPLSHKQSALNQTLSASENSTRENSASNNSASNNSDLTYRTSLTTSTYYQQPSSNYAKALNLVNTWWQTHLTTPSPYLTNGSGLCRECKLTAQNLAELLRFAYSHPEFNHYVNSLGVAGISGTISGHKYRLPHSAAIGRAWIKTGTLDNTTAMAGYVKGLSGQDYVVVGIINSDEHADGSVKLNTTAARRTLDTLLDWVAQH